MERTLIVFCHPALEKSRTNRALIEGVADLDGVTVSDLYERYPDFLIDVKREQDQLVEHERIVWQFPLFWYSTPSLMKEWMDVVFQYGWAYGRGGNALAGKRVKAVVTTGADAGSYTAEGFNGHTVRDLLLPLERSARMCGMEFAEPLVFYDALKLDGGGLARAVADYRKWLKEGD
ncbi:MAG: NAD(P)H-dependent oxidoreductase [Verrucomicrobiota bacterium JB025]|nr:NAD(P)H-dependent oxidoreductase [Verrucomicrobiota bacterium JB025]